jgi:hypothetical protein
MELTKCAICGERYPEHETHECEMSQSVPSVARPSSTKTSTIAKSAGSEPKAAFDRNAYQKAYMKNYMKDYMRSWRKRQKEKKDGLPNGMST